MLSNIFSVKKNHLYSSINIYNPFGVFKSCAAHFDPIRRNFTEKLDLRTFFKQRIKRMSSNVAIIKGAEVPRVVLSGTRTLGGDEQSLVRSFVETLRNSPIKTKVNVRYNDIECTILCSLISQQQTIRMIS